MSVTHYAQTLIGDLPLADSPWITVADISSYDWETHEIILKAESAGLMGSFQDPRASPRPAFSNHRHSGAE